MSHPIRASLFTSLSLLTLLASLSSVCAEDAVHSWTIPNDLKLYWPADLLSLEAPDGTLPPEKELAIETDGVLRPVQFSKEGKKTRVWSVMTLGKTFKDEKGHTRTQAPEKATANLVRLAAPLPAESRLQLTESSDFYTLSSGLYEFRLRKYNGRLKKPTALSEFPHWIAGMRPTGTESWDGHAVFDSDAKVVEATTEIVEAGPVYVTARVRYLFEGSEKPDGTVKALPLANGKQTHRWEPATFPMEETPKYERYYEALIRFVWKDPWIDVNERVRLPQDNTLTHTGFHQYRVAWGKAPKDEKRRAFTPIDTITWVRWFEWDTFGGNIDQKWVPAEQRPAQKDRPFALLRPLWNQGGGGAQDFFATRAPKGDEPTGELPMFGVVAAFPSKWHAPYAQTIAAFAEDGDRAWCRFPLISGESGKVWYAQRAYGLCVGPRRSISSLNDIVRRHTDWTLEAQVNRYILRWEGGSDRSAGGVPDAWLYLDRRYQDDFLNPTQRMTRSIKNYRNTKPGSCGPMNAALGYIYTDYDHWMGWNFGWAPGNPNFHTDKYMGTLFIASAMPEHPHSKEWLQYGIRNYVEDQKKVFFEPDGVGYECPGYAGYSMNLQLDIAENLVQNRLGNDAEKNPLFAKNARWHRHLLTPVDPRLGFRHEAPHGDTHRWTSGIGLGFGRLAILLAEKDPASAAEFRSIGDELARTGSIPRQNWQSLMGRGLGNIQPTPLQELDWGSHAFDGFGAVFRDRFGTAHESFVSTKAGRVGGHYHNDDLTQHVFLDGAPISLDYNCSYHPRGDHAALHNSVTFGVDGTVEHNGRGAEVEAMEQIGGRGKALAFRSSPEADVFVAERSGSSLALSPVDPHDAEFSRSYPSRTSESPLTHRRMSMLVKPANHSRWPAFFVVRDELSGPEPAQLNIHLLARDLRGKLPSFDAAGQWNRDISLYIAYADEAKAVKRAWYYIDDSRAGPLGDTPVPPDTKPEAVWAKKVHESKGKALIPPKNWTSTWMFGEYQQWLRLYMKPNTSPLWVLFPTEPNGEKPTFAPTEDGAGLSITFRGETCEVRLSSEHGASVSRNGSSQSILDPLSAPSAK